MITVVRRELRSRGTIVAVLSAMRDRRGNPNWLIRGLALVVALLLAGPGIAMLVLRGIEALLSVL